MGGIQCTVCCLTLNMSSRRPRILKGQTPSTGSSISTSTLRQQHSRLPATRMFTLSCYRITFMFRYELSTLQEYQRSVYNFLYATITRDRAYRAVGRHLETCQDVVDRSSGHRYDPATNTISDSIVLLDRLAAFNFKSIEPSSSQIVQIEPSGVFFNQEICWFKCPVGGYYGGDINSTLDRRENADFPFLFIGIDTDCTVFETVDGLEFAKQVIYLNNVVPIIVPQKSITLVRNTYSRIFVDALLDSIDRCEKCVPLYACSNVLSNE